MNVALKEWASVVAALDSGSQICLLRKGGIIEADRGGFELRYRQFLLFPTYEHEHTLLLQERYKRLVVEPKTHEHEISLFCEVTDVVTTAGLESLIGASNQFVWNETFLRKRLDYKPNLPLYAILLRAYRLPTPIRIPDRVSYAGCKSWVHLTEEIETAHSVPVLSEQQFANQRDVLLESLQRNLALR